MLVVFCAAILVFNTLFFVKNCIFCLFLHENSLVFSKILKNVYENVLWHILLLGKCFNLGKRFVFRGRGCVLYCSCCLLREGWKSSSLSDSIFDNINCVPFSRFGWSGIVCRVVYRCCGGGRLEGWSDYCF